MASAACKRARAAGEDGESDGGAVAVAAGFEAPLFGARVVGHEAVTRLKQLPTEFARLKPRAKALGVRASALRVSSVFVRRYTADTRPWFMFHHDVPPLTANVALAGAPHARQPPLTFSLRLR